MSSSVPIGCLNPCSFCQFVAGAVTNGSRSFPCTAEIQCAELYTLGTNTVPCNEELFTASVEHADYVPRILGLICRAELIGQLQALAALHTAQTAAR